MRTCRHCGGSGAKLLRVRGRTKKHMVFPDGKLRFKTCASCRGTGTFPTTHPVLIPVAAPKKKPKGWQLFERLRSERLPPSA